MLCAVCRRSTTSPHTAHRARVQLPTQVMLGKRLRKPSAKAMAAAEATAPATTSVVTSQPRQKKTWLASDFTKERDFEQGEQVPCPSCNTLTSPPIDRSPPKFMRCPACRQVFGSWGCVGYAKWRCYKQVTQGGTYEAGPTCIQKLQVDRQEPRTDKDSDGETKVPNQPASKDKRSKTPTDADVVKSLERLDAQLKALDNSQMERQKDLDELVAQIPQARTSATRHATAHRRLIQAQQKRIEEVRTERTKISDLRSDLWSLIEPQPVGHVEITLQDYAKQHQHSLNPVGDSGEVSKARFIWNKCPRYDRRLEHIVGQYDPADLSPGRNTHQVPRAGHGGSWVREILLKLDPWFAEAGRLPTTKSDIEKKLERRINTILQKGCASSDRVYDRWWEHCVLNGKLTEIAMSPEIREIVMSPERDEDSEGDEDSEVDDRDELKLAKYRTKGMVSMDIKNGFPPLLTTGKDSMVMSTEEFLNHYKGGGNCRMCDAEPMRKRPKDAPKGATLGWLMSGARSFDWMADTRAPCWKADSALEKHMQRQPPDLRVHASNKDLIAIARKIAVVMSLAQTPHSRNNMAVECKACNSTAATAYMVSGSRIHLRIVFDIALAIPQHVQSNTDRLEKICVALRKVKKITPTRMSAEYNERVDHAYNRK
eukprot:SAG25_NODE_129_length_14495_cov_41.326202_8_plen_654_part_00